MNHRQRALGRTNLDLYARSMGVRDAASLAHLVHLVHRVANGARVSAEDVAFMAGRSVGLPPHEWQLGSDWANSAATARDRAARVARIIAFGISQANPNLPVDASRVLEKSLHLGERLEVQAGAQAVADKLRAREEHRDRHAGIDQTARVAAAKRAAMQNPDAIRRAEVERAVAQHEGPTPTLYAADRREVLASANERIAERLVRQQVRDADPNRRPDRGDDRRSDLALQIDRLMVEEASLDEIALAENPLLEAVDDVATAEEAREKEA